ncbi:hypothetical protein A4X13_0g2522 [Tilletia indica]|uniref:Uncharacterized protein n=1 Tax=Tilletia indica TaxID=43049 RepID=A0A177TIZ0_9BASI|nr:hypothetical protein A4X13_0g2522 [Tilletia indica]
MVKTTSPSVPALAGIFFTLSAASLAFLASSPARVLAAPTGDGLHERYQSDVDHLAGRQDRPTPVFHFVARDIYDRRQNVNTSSPVPTSTGIPGDPNANGRPTTALSVFIQSTLCAQPYQNTQVPFAHPSRRAEPSDAALLRPRQQTMSMTSLTATISPSAGGGGEPGGNGNFLNTANLPAPFLAFAVAAIALFVLVVAFVLLRIFVRNRRLRRLGLLPGDLSESGRLVGSGREIEDNLVPPKLWEATIADLEQVQRLKAARSAQGEKVNDWDGIMPIAVALPTQLYTALMPDGTKGENANKSTTYPPTAQANREGQTGFSQGTARSGLVRLLRRSRGHTADATSTANAGADPANQSNAGALNGGSAADDPATAALNDVPLPAAVNVTVLIAMPSPKTVVPSSKQPKTKKSMMSFISGASASKPSLIPAQLSTTKVDEVDEEYLVMDDKGKTRREPSLRSVRTGISVSSFAEARREAFFKSEESGHEAGKMDMPLGDDRSGFGYDNDKDDEEEELPELMFGTASVPMYRDWTPPASSATPAGGSSDVAAAAPVPQDLLIPTRGDLLKLLAAARQVKERKTSDVLAQQKAAAKKEMEDVDGDDDAAGGYSSDGVHLTRTGDTSVGGANAFRRERDGHSSSRTELDDAPVGRTDAPLRDGTGMVSGPQSEATDYHQHPGHQTSGHRQETIPGASSAAPASAGGLTPGAATWMSEEVGASEHGGTSIRSSRFVSAEDLNGDVDDEAHVGTGAGRHPLM